MGTFLRAHGPQVIETAITIALVLGLRYIAGLAVRGTVLRSSFKAREVKEVMRIVDLLALLVSAVVLTGIWGVKQSELLIFATSVITVLGVAFFAEMSILSNITAFLVIFFQHPVKLGDRIRVQDGDRTLEGELIDITWFFTHIRGDDGAAISLPNAVLLKSPFTIFPRPGGG